MLNPKQDIKEKILIAKFKAGDEDSFNELYEEYKNSMYILAKTIYSTSDVKKILTFTDVYNECLLSIYYSAIAYELDSKILYSTYLNRVARKAVSKLAKENDLRINNLFPISLNRLTLNDEGLEYSELIGKYDDKMYDFEIDSDDELKNYVLERMSPKSLAKVIADSSENALAKEMIDHYIEVKGRRLTARERYNYIRRIRYYLKNGDKK